MIFQCDFFGKIVFSELLQKEHMVCRAVDTLGLHLQIRLLFLHQCLNNTFNFPRGPRGGTLDVLDTTFVISPIDTSVVAK